MEKPLFVRVAEALGWTDLAPGATGQWLGRNPRGGSMERVPDFQKDWVRTGPLIDELRPLLYWEERHGGWVAGWPSHREDRLYGTGATALDAVCALLLALAEAGRLPEGLGR